MTVLCDLAYKYGTDKCPQLKHNFTEFYHEMFRDRREQVRKVVEIGIGCIPPAFNKGASLYMWRDYFPNATIYGADINPHLLIEDDRIETILCDKRSQKDLENLLKFTGYDVDLFVDDGSHKPEDQVFTCLSVMPLLGKDAIYVIEDVGHREIGKRLGEFDIKILRRAKMKYNDNCMIVVRHGEY